MAYPYDDEEEEIEVENPDDLPMALPNAMQSMPRESQSGSNVDKDLTSNILMEYLKNKPKATPKPVESEASWNDPAFMASIARSMAQLGTIGGKAPSAEPFVDYLGAKQKKIDDAKLLSAKQSELDNKREFDLIKALNDQNFRGNLAKFNAGEKGKIEDKSFENAKTLEGIKHGHSKELAKVKSDYKIDDKEKKLDPVQKYTVEVVAKKVANQRAMSNKVYAAMSRYKDKLDLSKSDPLNEGKYRKEALGIAQDLLKTLNSEEGSDALGAEEVSRLAPELDEIHASIINPRIGFDLPGFYRRASNRLEIVKDSIRSNEKDLTAALAGSYTGRETPALPELGTKKIQEISPDKNTDEITKNKLIPPKPTDIPPGAIATRGFYKGKSGWAIVNPDGSKEFEEDK
jgi:hypothetical protein